jgi:hypothetical protein
MGIAPIRLFDFIFAQSVTIMVISYINTTGKYNGNGNW